jgi:nucleotide-binding universal stress UspA family protein
VGRLVEKLRRSGLEVEDRFEDRAATTNHAQLVIVAIDEGDDAGAARAYRLAGRGASVPTLLLRDPVSLLRWVGGRSRLRALACVDASRAGQAPLLELAALRGSGACDATVVHVAVAANEQSRLGLRATDAHRTLGPRVEKALTAELQSWARRAGLLVGALSFKVVPAKGDIAIQLASLAHKHNAELVIVGAGRASGVSTLSRPSALRALVARTGNLLFVPPADVSATTPIARVLSVLAATDLTPAGNAAIPFAYSLVSRGGVVHLVHALVEPAEDAAALARRLRALVPSEAEAADITTEVHVPVGPNEVVVLASHAERLVVDALCLSTRPRSTTRKALSPSIAERLLLRCRRPVLLVPPQRHER